MDVAMESFDRSKNEKRKKIKRLLEIIALCEEGKTEEAKRVKETLTDFEKKIIRKNAMSLCV